jgi:hypothetical protein
MVLALFMADTKNSKMTPIGMITSYFTNILMVILAKDLERLTKLGGLG